MIPIEHHKGNQPYLVLHLPENYEDQPVEATLSSLAAVFDQALKLADSKERGYGGAWRTQGWMGNLSRLMSKTARLKNLLWRSHKAPDSDFVDEVAEDTALDMVNIAAFFTINYSEGNQWGNR